MNDDSCPTEVAEVQPRCCLIGLICSGPGPCLVCILQDGGGGRYEGQQKFARPQEAVLKWAWDVGTDPPGRMVWSPPVDLPPKGYGTAPDASLLGVPRGMAIVVTGLFWWWGRGCSEGPEMTK